MNKLKGMDIERVQRVSEAILDAVDGLLWPEAIGAISIAMGEIVRATGCTEKEGQELYKDLCKATFQNGETASVSLSLKQ